MVLCVKKKKNYELAERKKITQEKHLVYTNSAKKFIQR